MRRRYTRGVSSVAHLDDELLVSRARRRIQERPWFAPLFLLYPVAVVVALIVGGALSLAFPPLAAPLWLAVIALVVLPWWTYSRTVRGEYRRLLAMRDGRICEACGYDMAGASGAMCPECGEQSEGRRAYLARCNTVLGHGVDLAEVARVAEMVERHGERFLDRVFTSAERGFAQRSRRRMAEHLAARFAAKEAVLKAMGTGLRGGIRWTDVEVTRDGEGRPGVRLAGAAARRAQLMGIRRWVLSLSHTSGVAMASAIAIGEEPDPRRRGASGAGDGR